MSKFSYRTIVAGMKHHQDNINFSIDLDTKWEGKESDGFVGYVVVNEFTLVRDKDNKYDKWAVKVLMDGRMIGWIPRENSEDIGEEIDKGTQIKVAQAFVLLHGTEFIKLEITLEGK